MALTMSKYESNRIFVLNEPNAPRLSPQLAVEIGLNESILLLQIEFLIAVSEHEIDGNRWTYQSVTDFQKMFPFWSRATINRTIHSLEEQGLIVVANHNQLHYDKTRWFALDWTGVRKLESVTLCLFQNGMRSDQNGTGSAQDETTIPESTTETTTEKTKLPSRKKKKTGNQPDPRVNAVVKEYAQLLGYDLPSWGRETAAAKWLLGQGYTAKQIIECWQDISADSFWEDKHCSLTAIQTKIAKWLEARDGSRVIKIDV